MTMWMMFTAFLLIYSIGAKHFLIETEGQYEGGLGPQIKAWDPSLLQEETKVEMKNEFLRNHLKLQKMKRNKRNLIVGSKSFSKRKVWIIDNS